MGISNNNTNVNAFDSGNVVVFPQAYGDQATDPNLVPGLLCEGDHDIITVTAAGDVQFGKAVYPGGVASGDSVKGTAFGIAARSAKTALKYASGEQINVVTGGKMFTACIDGCSKGGSVYSDNAGNLYGTSHVSDVAPKSEVTITATSTVASKTVKVRFAIDGKGYNYSTTTSSSQPASQIATALAAATCKDDDNATATLPTGWTFTASSAKVTMAFGTAGLGKNVTGTFDGGEGSGVTGTVSNTASANANAIQNKWKWDSAASAGEIASLNM